MHVRGLCDSQSGALGRAQHAGPLACVSQELACALALHLSPFSQRSLSDPHPKTPPSVLCYTRLHGRM